MNLENVPCKLPQEEWGLDPMFWTSAKLFVGDLDLAIPAEPTSSTVFFIGNGHVIRSIELVGIVVSVRNTASKMTTYQRDTLCIEGRIAVFKSERQVIIRTSKTIKPEEETLGWLERLSLRRFLATSVV
ncbi:hypothetical protein GGI15_002972 [Coemansia interrupta]|uniref:Uncharacterized protein n=1 Tax=Coemansia interrupta TaxID=1126814 RepID=A0A9W8HHP6_9FUNG|nr:hypothetical protein GGI15_002972 [Coemansia interrupta]